MTLNLKLEALRAAVLAEPRDLVRINERLRALLVKVVVDWPNERLVLHWRYGGHSYAGFWRKRQKRTARNISRSVEATRHRPNNFPPEDHRAGEIFEGEFMRWVLVVLKRAEGSLPAREVALRLAETAGQLVPDGEALVILMQKVQRTFSQP